MARFPFARIVSVTLLGATMVAATTVTATASTTSATRNAADAALVPAALKNTTLQVATDATYAPDESMSGNTMTGFDVDLMKAIATTLGVKVVENNVTFSQIIVGIGSGKYAVGNSSFTDNTDREKQVNFVDYYRAGEGVYAKASSTFHFTNLTSLCGQTVAVETGTVEQSDAAAIKCTGGRTVTVTAYATQTAANAAVSSGHAAVGFVDSQIAGYVVTQSKGLFKLVGHPVNVAPYGIATAKTTTGHQLAVAIAAAIKTLIAGGVYQAIMAKYGATAGDYTAGQVVLNGAGA